MRRKVYFHGPFKDAHPGPVEVVASSVREAIEIVTSQLEFFQPDLRGRKHVRVVGCDTIQDLERTDMEEIHILPPVTGGKKNGLTQIIIGAVLITAAIFTGGTTIPAMLALQGASFILGGLIQMLAPTPKADNEDPKEQSQYLGATGNTTKIGTRIPLLFGRDMVFGHYLSFDVDAKDVAV